MYRKGEVRLMRGRTAVLMCLILLIVAFLVTGASAARSQVFMNDTGSVAYGLRVTFDRGVSVTDMGQGFSTWEAEETRTVILFKNGQIEPWTDFYFFWEPGEARVIGYEWISQIGDLGTGIRQREGSPLFLGATVQHYLAERIWDNNWKYINPLKVLKERGFEWVRVCLTTRTSSLLRNTPPSDWGQLPWDEHYMGTLEYAEQIVREASELGLKVNLVLYLSHDEPRSTGPKDYPRPPKWQHLTTDELAKAVRRYCFETIQYFKDRGLDVEIYDIGSEIEFGFLGYLPQPWGNIPVPAGINPTEDVGYMRDNVWNTQAQLIKAATAGIRGADPDAKITLHVTGFYHEPLVKAFFETMVEQGVEFDYGGLSYCSPSRDWEIRFFDNPFSYTESVIEFLASLGKKVLFSEFLYYSDSAGVAVSEDPLWRTRPKWITHVPAPGYPFTVEGHAKWMRDFLAFCRENDSVIGAFYFWPDSFGGSSGGSVQHWDGDESYGPFETDTQFRPTMSQFALDPPVFPTIELVDEADSSLSWSSTWNQDRNSKYSGGSARISSRRGASVTIPFAGTGIALIYTANDNHGIAEVEVDGMRYPDIDMYSPTMEPVFRLTDVIARDLPPGEHILTITVTDRKNPASSGNVVAIDAVDIIRAYPKGAPLDTNPPELVNLELGSETIDTSEESQELEIRTEVRDGDSGIAYVAVEFVSPSGKETLSIGLHLTEGIPNEGRFVGMVRFPQYTESGMWTIKRVWAGDNAFPDQNVGQWNTSQLRDRDFITELEVLAKERPTADVSVMGGSIQQVINEASPGDVIDIPGGVYEENLVIEKSITLRGSSTDKPLIGGGSQEMPVIRVESFSREIEITFEGLRIGFAKGRNGNGIEAHGKAKLHLVNVEIMNNEAHGIELADQVQATITNCLFMGMGHSGVEFYGSTQGTIRDCTIVENGAYGLWIHGSAEVEVTDSRVSENGFESIKFDGIYAHEKAKLTIERSEVTNNCKCGIRAESADNIVTCAGNTVSGNGEGDYCGFSPDE